MFSSVDRWALCSLVGMLALAGHVSAHGLPPAAVAVVAQDAQGPRIVRLTAGLALRESDGDYRFVCPNAWGDVDSLPAYALPDEPAVVLSSSGLWLLQDDGSVTRHPDARADGYAFDLAAQGDKLFVLRTHDRTGSEIIEVSATQVKSLWRDAALWTSLSAGSDFLAVARLTQDDRLAQKRLTPRGEVLSSNEGQAPAGTVNVLARGVGNELFLTLAFNGGRHLGRLDDSGWKPVQSANAAIAGPVQLEEGGVYLALDGSLARLDSSALAPLEAASSTPLSCLGCYGTQCYACTRDGLKALEASGLGATTFELSKLVRPRVEGMSDEDAARCELQWEHFRFDLLAFGVSLREGEDAAPAAVGGRTAPAAAGGSMAGASGNAAPKPAADAGCSCALPGRPAAGSGVLLMLASLVFGRSLRRRRS